ncbi:MAG TPA: hypothetical protein PKW21_11565, partial [Rhabdaerophilum sp.]|nr:hypothetical protein [Rhabdaerophilum sp.]
MDLWLVDEGELFTLDGAAQLVVNQLADALGLRHPMLVKRETVAPLVLRPIERCIGGAQDCGDIHAVIRREGNADRDADAHRCAVHRK